MHRLCCEQRNGLKITGVTNVNSFDGDTILLDTEEGRLVIKGSNLHVSRLDLEKGEADIDGKIISLVYSEAKSIVKHLFS